MTVQTPANWYPDPSGRNEFRYWDGNQWTHHVSTHGYQGTDPLVAGSPSVPVGWSPSRNAYTNAKVQRQVKSAGVVVSDVPDGDSLLTARVLVVNQKAKLIEVNAEYAVYNAQGRQIGAVREVGQSLLRNAVSVRPNKDRTKRLHIVDLRGWVLITLTRPAKFARSTIIARRPDGTEIGRIVQKNFGVLGKVRFGLESNGQTLGSINAEGWTVWDFNIQDTQGTEVSRITKTGLGSTSKKSMKRDRYVVEIHRHLDDPLRSLVLAAALAIDTALRQQ